MIVKGRLVMIMLVSALIAQSITALATGTEDAPSVVAAMSIRDRIILLADNGCNQVYMFDPNKTLSRDYWSSLARSGSGETVYYRGSPDEYLDLIETIDGILGDVLLGKYKTLRTLAYKPEGETRFRITGLVVYVNPGFLDNNTIEEVKEAIGPVMVGHNLTNLVVIEALSDASWEDVMSMVSSIAVLLDRAYAGNISDVPGYLRMGRYVLQQGYQCCDIWPDAHNGYAGVGFYRPMPPPTLGDLEEIAWWLLNHTDKCGVPIVIDPELAEPLGVLEALPLINSSTGSVPGTSQPTYTPGTLGSPQADNSPTRATTDDARDDYKLAAVTLISSVVVGSLLLFFAPRLWKPYRGM